MKRWLLSFFLLCAVPAQAAITNVCNYSVPADNGTQTSPITLDIDGNCTLQSSDFVYVLVTERVNDPTFSVTTTGGQSWSSLSAQNQGGSSHAQVHYFTFNGTFSADPVIDTTGTNNAFTIWVVAFRPTASNYTWAVDVAQSIGNTTPTTPFDVTVAGQTAVASSTVTLAFGLATSATGGQWALQTAGWNNPGSVAQVRNQQGTDTSVWIAYKINTAAGATGSVAERQTTQTGTTTVYGIVTFKEVAPANPSFSSGPTVSATSATGYTISFTPDQSSTAYFVASKKGSTAPTCDQIEANTAPNGQEYETKAVTGADSVTFSSLDYPTHDIHGCLEAGTADSAVSTLSNQLKQPPSGYLYDVLSSVGTGSVCDDITSPDVVATDIVERYSSTSPGSFSAPALNDCHVSYSGDESRQLICYRIYDNSAQDWMSIASPSAQCTGTRAALWFQNQTPVAAFEPGSVRIFGMEGVPIAPVSMQQYCLDADDEQSALVVTNVDALPAGLSVTNSVLSGTPTTRGVTTGVTFRCTDITGAFADWD